MTSEPPVELPPEVLRLLERSGARADAPPSPQAWRALLELLAADGAGAALHARDAFFANMSHELRTPMTVVMGGLQLLCEADLPEDHRQIAQAAHQAGASLVRIVDDLLDFSKIEAGQLELLERDFDLHKLVKQTCDSFRAVASHKRLELSLHIDDKIPRRLRGDALRLRQVLQNLIANAFKFTEEGGVRVAIASDGESLDGARLRITVADTGIGIEEAALTRLFEPFAQVDASPRRRHGGAGIGLAIARRLAELMGGELGVSSVVGKGSAFRFTVHLKPPHLTTELAESRPPPSGAWPRASRGRVLLAEDNEFNRLLVARALVQLELEVEIVSSGREALEALGCAAFDLVLMDCQMPELDGYATARLVRQLDSAACGVPIIALTANALHGDRERCLDAGMNDYVKKPFLLSELRQKVLRWLDRDPMESIRPSPSEVADPVIERLAVVDMTRLNELAQQAGTDSIVIELSQIFLEDIATRLQVLRAAYHDGKLLQFQRTAHTIKGAAGNFGAARLAAIAGALEAAADFDQDTARRVEQACVEFETVRARLEAEVFGHGPRSRPAPAASLSTPNPPARAGAS